LEILIVENTISALAFVAFLAVVAMAVVIFNRARRGEKVSTDNDWRLLFGKPKADVLTRRYWTKLFLACFGYSLIGLFEYWVLIPFGLAWYIAGMAVTALIVVPLTPKLLR
jgi:hypothetical protein